MRALHTLAAALFAGAALNACQTTPPSASTTPTSGAGTTTAAAAPAPAASSAAPAASSPARPPTAPGSFANAPRPPSLSASGANPSSAATPPSALPPFASVVRDATRIGGPLVMWQKDEKLWIELAPAQLGQLFLLSPKIKNGIGEGAVLGGLMAYPVSGAGGTQIVEFVRVYNNVRLQARNTDAYAKAGTPEARSVASAFSASLLGSTPVASLPHPERKSILIDAGALFLTDMLGMGMQLQRAYRQGYSLDRGNSVITAARGSTEATIIETQSHFYSGNLSTFNLGSMANLPAPQVPSYLPDARSMLIGLHYSLSPLPATPMAARRADARIGHFTTTVLNFSDDTAHTPRQRIVTRWRLEKKDAAAEVSEPVKPVTFWIDRNVPLQYRDTVRAAILEWNKAFDAIGFRNAVVVQQQADDASFDTLDVDRASVRWMSNADSAFAAIGPSHYDPRSGEILDADVAIESMSSRLMRATRTQVLAPKAMNDGGVALPAFAEPFSFDKHAASHAYCTHGQMAAEQLSYALDVLEARGEMLTPEMTTQQFVLDYLKDTVMHEVGHALGLRHNFRASRVYSEEQLSDPEFTREHGTSGSVMEYNPINLAAPGARAGVPFQLTLGPYDLWAIEYAYRPMPPGTSAVDEDAALLRIASRSDEPLLAYGSDEDSAFGLDPETVQWDLGADPLAFAAKRLAIARDLFQRQETRVLPGDQDYAVLRRSLSFALGDTFRAVGVLVRHIGGVRTLRDFPGTGRDPLQPVTADVQRSALDLIAKTVLSVDGLHLSPALQRRLAPDYFDRLEVAVPTDYAVPQRLLELQRAVLAYLLSDTVAARVLDSVEKVDKPREAFRLSDLYARLSADVWSELNSNGDFSSARRDLQRDHATRLSLAVLRPTGGQRADARSLMRLHAQQLLSRIDMRLNRGAKPAIKPTTKPAPALDVETRAHLQESAELLRQALSARVVRVGV